MNLLETYSSLAQQGKKVAIFITGNDAAMVGTIVKLGEDYLVLKRTMNQEFCIPFSSIAYFQVRE